MKRKIKMCYLVVYSILFQVWFFNGVLYNECQNYIFREKVDSIYLLFSFLCDQVMDFICMWVVLVGILIGIQVGIVTVVREYRIQRFERICCIKLFYIFLELGNLKRRKKDSKYGDLEDRWQKGDRRRFGIVQ